MKTQDSPLSKNQLVDYFESGCKSRERWVLGTEYEKFLYRNSDLHPLNYQGEKSISAVLKALTAFGWKGVYENKNIIGLVKPDGSQITLEPGGQLEFSSTPSWTLKENDQKIKSYLKEINFVSCHLGVGVLALGFQPKWGREDSHWMPKKRYRIMRQYMPRKGKLGLDMMLSTCSTQVSLDYSDEKDMVLKFRVSLALQPIVTALFAYSPFVMGKLSGFQSYRSYVWSQTDSDRSGDLPFVFEEGFGFERYTDYVLEVPMYLVKRNENYYDASGLSFRNFMKGQLEMMPGTFANLQDWIHHAGTVFPHTRLKRFLEIRGADVGPRERISALGALYVGLLYDKVALDEAWQLVRDWSAEERKTLIESVPRQGLSTLFRTYTVCDLAKKMLSISKNGLKRWNKERLKHLQNKGKIREEDSFSDESHQLDCLFSIVESKKSPAVDLIELYLGKWNKNIDSVFSLGL